MNPKLEIRAVDGFDVARPFIAKGYDYGLPMPQDAINYFGVRREDPRFVVVGVPTEYATLSISILVGLIPNRSQHPHEHLRCIIGGTPEKGHDHECELEDDGCDDFECPAIPAFVPLAERVIELVSDQLARGTSLDLLAEGQAGEIILAWRRRQERRQEPMWEEAATDWLDLITGHDGMSHVPTELAAARAAEIARLKEVAA